MSHQCRVRHPLHTWSSFSSPRVPQLVSRASTRRSRRPLNASLYLSFLLLCVFVEKHVYVCVCPARTLDLCDRDGKYSNGFCHWPQVAWRKPDGAFVPSRVRVPHCRTAPLPHCPAAALPHVPTHTPSCTAAASCDCPRLAPHLARPLAHSSVPIFATPTPPNLAVPPPHLPRPPPLCNTHTQANFTSLATPSQVGSGKTALVTLLHEGGHAAHFANIDQPSPFFSQVRAGGRAGGLWARGARGERACGLVGARARRRGDQLRLRQGRGSNPLGTVWGQG